MIDYRPASLADAESIARLHTRNWQENYRAAFSAAFLDDELPAAHMRGWREQLTTPVRDQFVECAFDSTNLAGFVCAFGGADMEWGSFVDNLHVAREMQGQRIGAALMQRAGAWLAQKYPDLPVYLFVFEGNTAAQRFYERIGGHNAGLITEQLHGQTVRSHRYMWPNPRVLDSP